MPSDTFSHSVRVPASPSEIRAALDDAETWAGIGPIERVWDARSDEDGLAGFRWSARAAGRTWEGSATRTGVSDASMTLDLESSEITGTITVSATGSESGSELSVELRAASRGLLSGMFWGVVSDALRRGLASQIEAFAARFA